MNEAQLKAVIAKLGIRIVEPKWEFKRDYYTELLATYKDQLARMTA